MNLEAHEKVSAEQLNKEAYLYVRQSTLRQVVENTESTERQYALRQRAIALGWPDDRMGNRERARRIGRVFSVW
jgi:DNA invertase Pin-like site-specific DNA recombinase